MLHVTEAKYIGDYKISVAFNDGCRIIADFEKIKKSFFHGGSDAVDVPGYEFHIIPPNKKNAEILGISALWRAIRDSNPKPPHS